MAEKWNQVIREHGDVVENQILRKKIDDIIYKTLDFCDEIPKLEKTEVELQVIKNLNSAITHYLDCINIDKLTYDESHIFVVDLDYYREQFDTNLSAHIVHDGINSRIIIPRMQDINKFVSVLSHEMVHGISYQRTKVEFSIGEDKTALTSPVTIGSTIRFGFRFVKNTDALDDHQGIDNFTGMNEALTEFIAYRIRMFYYVAESKKADEISILSKMSAYILEFGILHRILQRYKVCGGDDQDFMADVQRGYFSGDMTVFKKLKLVHPDAVRLLRDMKYSNIESLLETARGFGLPEYVRYLEEIAKTIKK
jgi:hypothetical protein